MQFSDIPTNPPFFLEGQSYASADDRVSIFSPFGRDMLRMAGVSFKSVMDAWLVSFLITSLYVKKICSAQLAGAEEYTICISATG